MTLALEGFEGLIGYWRGAIKGSAVLHDECCFTPMFDGVSLRDAPAVVGGPAMSRGEAISRFNPRRQHIQGPGGER